ncbi:PepSY domain-containing protein [Robiginitomaculum antarcticum]|uniref:PepSY domain-containing protein n=1 Tax=Robiginitomaculum antarcticum TaxID=437507 RepID=UPI000372CD9D|nr:PepSY domain-containing protein [Robiginitomaculum antarcticum]
MNQAILNRNLRKLHLWFGIGIGLQLGLWLISGLFMTLFPIDQVRGTHLRATQLPQTVSAKLDILHPSELISKHALNSDALTLKLIAGEPVYIVTTSEKTQAFNAKTGEVQNVMDEVLATQIAIDSYAGRSAQTTATLFEEKAPREYGRAGPVWRIDFKKPDAASFYVDAMTGELKAVRTGLWRTFDFMWGLHIMDWKSRENFNSWWIKTVASLAVFFFFTGFGLAILRIRSSIKRRKRLE